VSDDARRDIIENPDGLTLKALGERWGISEGYCSTVRAGGTKRQRERMLEPGASIFSLAAHAAGAKR
jgi:hypothetical protein